MFIRLTTGEFRETRIKADDIVAVSFRQDHENPEADVYMRGGCLVTTKQPHEIEFLRNVTANTIEPPAPRTFVPRPSVRSTLPVISPGMPVAGADLRDLLESRTRTGDGALHRDHTGPAPTELPK
jgi:hypothetical protein